MIELHTPDAVLFEKAFRMAKIKLRGLIEKHPDFYPMYTVAGRWRHEGESWTHWCDGFLPGMLWIVYEHERASRQGPGEETWWLDQAIRYTKTLEPRKFDRNVHDLGFIFMSTYHRWFEMTQSQEQNDVLMEAGRTLALRFREKGGYLRSFISEESLFIDIMMNVGIIFYAALETGDLELMDTAMRHCLTTRRVLVRGDGSTAHEGLFNTETGEFRMQSTHQGYRGDSCWSRGLAWALYGFGTAFEYSRDSRLLETAEACANYYIEHTPADGVPPWDFHAPGPLLVDTSAAAIAASGLFQLAGLSTDRLKAEFYASIAHHIVGSLCRNYASSEEEGWEGILKGGVYHLHKDLGVGESVMWGEYFFMEALDRAMSLGN